MLEIVIPDMNDLFIDDEFVSIKGATLTLEHSLVSLHLWESKWLKPFLGQEEKTYEEIIDYIRCMTVSPKNVDPRLYYYMDKEAYAKIIEYINAPMTATWFTDNDKQSFRHRRETVTAELIYYWMITAGVPYEAREWHLNQLFTLIKVVSVKNAPEKKKSKQEAAMERKRLNAARRAKYNSKG